VQHRWLDHKRKRGDTFNACKLARERTAAFVEQYGSEPLTAITRALAQDWIDQHPSHYNDLQAMCNFAADELDAIVASPFKGKRPQPVSKTNPDLQRRALTAVELRQLAELAKRRHGVWHYLLILWMGYGGQRLAEALDTRVTGFDGYMPRGGLRVRVETQWRAEEQRSRHTKGTREGIIVIPGWLAREAQPLIEAAQQREDGLLFTTPRGERLQPQNYRTAYWYPLRERFAATLPETHWLQRRLTLDPRRGLTSHELRHTASTIIQASTADLNASRVQLRHSKERMTIKYTLPEDERGLAAVDEAYAAEVIPLRRSASS
jgi:integrase